MVVIVTVVVVVVVVVVVAAAAAAAVVVVVVAAAAAAVVVVMAGCRPLRTASSEVVSPLSRNAAFEDRRCLETPLCARYASRRSVAACRCLLDTFIVEAQASRLEAGDGMWLEPSLGATSPLPRCQPCPSSPIGHNGFLRLHRVEAICPRDAESGATQSHRKGRTGQCRRVVRTGDCSGLSSPRF